MAALTALQQMALEAPQLAQGSVTKNGETFTIPNLLQAFLDSNDQNVFLALAMLYECLAGSLVTGSVHLGDFSQSATPVGGWANFYDERRYYWERKYRGSIMGDPNNAPTLGVGWWGIGSPGWPWTGV